MSIVDANGNNAVLGDDMEVVRTVTGLTSAQTISKAWLTVKQRYSQADADAALQLVITSVSGDDGQITDIGTGATTGEVTFTIAGAHYDGLTAGVAYVYDIQLLLSDGVITTVEVDTVTWDPQVTRATS
jgi:hypothetical protein